MPAFSAAFASLVTTGINVAGTIGLTSFAAGTNFIGLAALGFLSKAGLGIALNALTPKPKVQSSGYQVNTRGSALDQQVIYGKTRVGGVVAYENVLDDVFLYTALVHAGHPVSSYEEVYVGETVVLDWIRYSDGATVTSADFAYNNHERYTPKTTATLDVYGNPVDSKVGIYFNKNTGSTVQNDNYNIYISFYDGNQTTANNFLVASFDEWTSDHKLQGCAYMVVNQAHASEKHNADAFPNGPKDITVTIKGKEVYDPRTLGTGWSDNPALCLRDYLTSDYGLGEDVANIDDTVITSAANACDVVANNGAKSFTCNGAFTTATQPADVLGDMLTSMGGLLWYSQGKWRMKPAYWVAPTLTLNEDDLRSAIAVKTRISRRDNFNKVRGTFRGEETAWQVSEFPEVRNITPTTTEVAATALTAGEWYQIKTVGTTDFELAGASADAVAGWAFQATGATTGTGVVYTTVDANLAADGGQESAIDLEMPFTTNYAEARRIARITLERSRQQLTVSASFGLKAFKLQVGDNVRLTNARFGWTNKEFEVVSWTFGLVDGYDLQVQMTLRETAESIFDEVDDSVIYERDNSDDTYVPVGPVVNLAAALDGIVATDGSFVNSIRVTWDAPALGRSTGYLVEWKETGATVYNSVLVNDTAYNLVPIKDDTVYGIRVASYGAFNNLSTYETDSIDSSKDGTTPNTATTLVTNPLDTGAVITWTAPTTNTDTSALNDLFYYDVYRGTSTAPTTFIGRVSGTSYTDTGLTNGTTYYYRVKAVDFSGNSSAYSAEETVLPAAVGAGDSAYEIAVANGFVGTEAEWLASLEGTDGTNGTNGDDGLDAINTLISPAAVALPASSLGVVSSYSGSGCLLSVKEGNVALSSTTGGSVSAGQWRVSDVGVYTNGAASTDITPGAKSDSAFDIAIANHSAMANGVDNVKIIYFIQYRTAANVFGTTEITQNISKAKAGANGTDGDRGAGRWHIDVDGVVYDNGSGTATGALPAGTGDAQEAWDEGIGNQPTTPTADDQAWFYKGALATPSAQSVWIYNGTSWIEQDEVIDGNLLVTGRVTADKLKLNGVELQDDGTGALQVNAISATKLSAGTIDASVITVNNLNATNISTGTMSASRLDVDGVTITTSGSSLVIGTVDTGQLADGAITSTKLDTSIASTNFNGTFDVGGDILTDGTVGWAISRSGDKAVFNDATIRGTLDAANITVSGTFNAAAINLNGTMLEDSGGALQIVSGGVDTTQIASGAITSTKLDTSISSTNFNGTFDGGGDILTDGTIGWAISRSGDKAVFNDATIRGTLDAANITVSGTFNAAAINLNGTMLEDSGGALQIVSGGVDTGQLASGAVTSIKFADTIQSDVFTAGSAGWQITKSTGDAEFNGITARGTVRSDVFTAGSAGWEINSNGNAEFNNATIRGTLDASDITVTGTFSAAEIISANSSIDRAHNFLIGTKNGNGGYQEVCSIDTSDGVSAKPVEIDWLFEHAYPDGSGPQWGYKITYNHSAISETTLVSRTGMQAVADFPGGWYNIAFPAPTGTTVTWKLYWWATDNASNPDINCTNAQLRIRTFNAV